METTKSKRRWFRYSLRAMFVLVTCCALVLGWLAHQARTQKLAVQSIQSAGGSVMYDYHEAGPRAWSTVGKPRGPQWLRDALGTEYFDIPSKVGIHRTPEDNKWVEAFNDLPTVKTLLLSGPNVNDGTLARLRTSSALVELHLTDSAITDAGLTNLDKFPNLLWLNVQFTRVTNGALEKLREHHPSLTITGP